MNDPVRTAAAFSATLANQAQRFVTPFAARFRSCVEILALSEALVSQQHKEQRSTYENGDVLIWGIGTRTIKTYRATVYLASLGHGTQGVILARTLIEDALTVAWVDSNRDEALRLMDMHERHSKHLWGKLLAERNLDLGNFASLTPLDPEELKKMAKAFGQYGERSWTGHRNLISLYKAIRGDWNPPNERDLLDHVVEVDLRYANLRTHNTALSIGRPQDIGNSHLYDASESTDDIPSALLLGFWAFAHATKHMLREPYRDQFMALYYERMPSFFGG